MKTIRRDVALAHAAGVGAVVAREQRAGLYRKRVQRTRLTLIACIMAVPILVWIAVPMWAQANHTQIQQMNQTGAYGTNPLNLPTSAPIHSDRPPQSGAGFGNLPPAPTPTPQPGQPDKAAIVSPGDLLPVPGGSIIGRVQTGPTPTPGK